MELWFQYSFEIIGGRVMKVRMHIRGSSFNIPLKSSIYTNGEVVAVGERASFNIPLKSSTPKWITIGSRRQYSFNIPLKSSNWVVGCESGYCEWQVSIFL